MSWRRLALLMLVCTLAGCQESSQKQERSVSDLIEIAAPSAEGSWADIRDKLAFTCAHEKDVIPPQDPEAEQLYQHARWLKKNNLLKEDATLYPKIERLIRIATAYGHDKANLELRQMIGKGQADSDDPVKETLDLTEDLMRRGIPGGYYDMGRYLERGYGVKQDKTLALKYYRKSADLGSPEGQYAVGGMLAPINSAPEVARQMRRCAAEQGHGKAALELGLDLTTDGLYSEALQSFQMGTKTGNDLAAFVLEKGFAGPSSTDRLNYIGQQKDDERVRRYHEIGSFLSDYSYLNPKVPEIDRIVPLPPAKLPPWDGKLEWLTAHEANVPPPLPSEARIAEMARAKGLDPETGRALPR